MSLLDDDDDDEVFGNINTASANPSTEKMGKVRKCPSCGEQVTSMTAICPSCKYEFSRVQVSQTVQSFFESYTNAPDSKKASIVRAFPIPNSREDILTFLVMGIGNTKELTAAERNTFEKNSGGEYNIQYREQEIIAWRAKVRQTLELGKLLFKDNENHSLFQKYERQLVKEEKKSRHLWRSLPRGARMVIAGVSIFITVAALLIGYIKLLEILGLD